MTVEQAIEFFLDDCRRYFEKTRQLETEASVLVCKLGYTALLDAVSTATYPEIEEEGAAFERFIREFCDWKDADRTSLPWLSYILDQARNPNPFAELRNFVLSQLQQWPRLELETVSFEKDPMRGEIESKWPGYPSSFQPIVNPNDRAILPERLTHASLVWEERNFLVHQLSSVAVSLKNEGREEPYYMWMPILHLGEDKGGQAEKPAGEWELVYPLKFLESLCDTSLSSGKLEDYLRANKIDPIQVLKSRRRLMV